MSVTLTPMTAEELEPLLGPLQRSYAEELVRHRGVSAAEALDRAAVPIRELLPAGAATEGVLLRTARVDGEAVGWIWVTLPGAAGATDAPPGSGRAWIHNIEVYPEHRGRGYARRMIQLVEAELARLGVPELGLNVFGSNTVAIRLYESLGFRVTAQQMAKPVAAEPASDPAVGPPSGPAGGASRGGS
ncbi:GNAT family N-acetyltransferase [Micromonospora costi]|uniref:GNAT family N-acetyltransferase n=1 Tax=Micromonospora costi TaxID=1530042 RepID=A0A3B0A9L4_9ACTN|nr:GNAT family N-acetyltransferase [Micromonospora costi]RKN55876.1 GNAT family N-acetyltransferase [Micromonospora costi]